MARIEAPAGAKAAGNSHSPEPEVTAPVVDSTGLGENPQVIAFPHIGGLHHAYRRAA